MASEIDFISKLSTNSKVDPTGFDVTMSAIFIGIGAEKYIDIFRKQNIGQNTLVELNEEDFIKLGVDDPNIRSKLLEEVKNLPIYKENLQKLQQTKINLSLIDIVDILEESSQHLYRIYLSMLANTLALKKTKEVTDCLLYKDKYASDIAVATLSEITTIINSMDIALHTEFKVVSKKSNKRKTKKIIVGAVGGVVIAVLAVLFVRSLKPLK